MTTLHIDRKDIPTSLSRAMGGYNGTKFRITGTERVTFHDMQWSGGTRSTYTVVNLETGETKPLQDPRAFPQNMGQPGSAEIELNWCVVEHSMFCGKDHGLTFHVHPDNMAKLLPEPGTALDPDVEAFLVATSCLKNTYGGRTNIRFEEASRVTGINPVQWSVAKRGAIELGYARKNGAITNEGRNAIANSKLRIQ